METKEKIFAFIQTLKPDSIFVLAAWNSYSPHTNREFITDDGEGEATPETTKRAIEKQVPYTLEKLSRLARVVVFKAWPFLPSVPIYDVNRLTFLERKKAIVKSTHAEFQKDSELIETVFESLNVPVEYFDPAQRVCNAQDCSSIFEGIRLYTDHYHISAAGALRFESEIESLISMDRQS